MGLQNVDMTILKKPSNFRKMSMGNWNGVGDPQIYAIVELNCEKALKYIEKLRQKHKAKVTVNHLVGRIIALTFKKYPQLNGMIANRKIYHRNSIDIFFQVSIEGAETELVGVKVRNADEKGIVEFAQNIAQKSERVRTNKNDPMRKAQNPFAYIPWRFMPAAIRFINWLQYDWNLNLSWFGIPKDCFGSFMVTSIGSFGLELAFVPLTHLGRCPLQVAIGTIVKKPVVVEDKIEIRPLLNLCLTLDHRFIDGLLGSKMVKHIKNLFENIDQYEALIEGKELPV